jgi:SAM-dependent methyltransferase
MTRLIQTIRSALLHVLPVWVVQLPGLLLRTRPVAPRTCNLCGFHGLFGATGRPPRLDALCPRCGSLERHRLLWLWLEPELTTLPTPILHFAPEPSVEAKLRASHAGDYTTADLYSAGVDEKLNLESIDRPDHSVGTIIANHVLEHVDDVATLAEFARILRPDGVLICEIPIVEGWAETYENPAVRGGAQADLHFGQSDHVRFYGADFRDRLRAAGFALSEHTAEGADVIRYGLVRGEKVFIARPAPAGGGAF